MRYIYAANSQEVLPDPLRRRWAIGLPLLAWGLLAVPANKAEDVVRLSQALMGTQVDITLQGKDRALLSEAARIAFAEMNRLADMMSRYKSDSALNAVNLMAGLQAVSIPEELMRVLLMAQSMAKTSGGAFDATVGAFRNWNFSPEYPLVPDAAQLQAQCLLVDPKGLVLDVQAGTAYLDRRGMRLDLGGVAKLPILQAGLRILHECGVSNAMLNGGGDVLVMGTLNEKPWRIGLRHPLKPQSLLGTVEISHGFVASSGDYERFLTYKGRRFHHILNPRTGYPTTGLHGVTLISEQMEEINGLGPALMVSCVSEGRSMLAERTGVDALMVDHQGKTWLTAGMSRRLKTV